MAEITVYICRHVCVVRVLIECNGVIINLPRKIGDARHEWADPWPKNWPNAISNSIIGMPTKRNSNKYGSKNATPCRSSSRGKRTTFAYVRFKHRHNITSRNIEHFDCFMNGREKNAKLKRRKINKITVNWCMCWNCMSFPNIHFTGLYLVFFFLLFLLFKRQFSL